jgi:predicted MFS family arabinose efflux permease
MYLVGGVCTFFTARWFGRLADQYGKPRVFRIIALLSMMPILALTHSPALPWWAVIVISTPFFILVSGRFVPGMAMVTSAGNPNVRGTFMSINSAVQSAGSGAAALVAGLVITRDAQGMIHNYPLVGYIACAATIGSIWMAAHVRPTDARGSATPQSTLETHSS